MITDRESFSLEDSRKRRLPVVSHCAYCYNSIWTDRPRDLIGEEYGALLAVSIWCSSISFWKRKRMPPR